MQFSDDLSNLWRYGYRGRSSPTSGFEPFLQEFHFFDPKEGFPIHDEIR
jgi:hypothetical protein